ncbi:hypothetical protein JCM17823_21640 [Halorubrum gandharaense]
MEPNGPQPAGTGPAGEAVSEAWTRTNDEREAIAAERREEGWEVASIPTVQTSTPSRAERDPERFGLAHVIPDNYADEFSEAYEAGEFSEYLVYFNTVHNSAFLVVEHMDPDAKIAIVLSAHYDIRHAQGMVRSAINEGRIHTYAKTINGTELGEFTHEEYRPFIPDPAKFDADMPSPDETA